MDSSGRVGCDDPAGHGRLVLSASRSAAVAVAVTILALVVWRWRRAGITLLVALAITIAVGLKLGAVDVAGFLQGIDAVGSASETLAGRLEIWDRALMMVRDFPFTGIGLNTFPIILSQAYPTFLPHPVTMLPHAHNIFLQTAVDFGLGGLLALLGLSAITAQVGWRTCRRASSNGDGPSVGWGKATDRGIDRHASVGLLLGLLSFLVYGLTDTLTFGAKPTVLLWLMLGLVVAAHRMIDTLEDQGAGHVPSALTKMTAARRLVALAATVIGGVFWTVSFFLVALGYAVTGIGLSGWTP